MPTPANAGDIEREEDTGAMDPVRAAKFWQQQIELAEREHKDWWKTGEKIEKLYRADEKEMAKLRKGQKHFSILFSNTQTLTAALYARTPKPDVRRRFLDRNPVARTAADILERCLVYCADTTDHDRTYKRGVQDHCLPGRGVVRYEYEPEFKQVPVIDPMTGQPAIDPMTGQPQMQEVIADQSVEECYVYWKDFLHNPARSWHDVWFVGFRHRMTREDLKENQFEDADKVPLNWSPDTEDKRDKSAGDDLKRAEVWEIWDERTKHRYWVMKGYPKALRVDEDPYGLEGFWPLQEPLAIGGNDTIIPTPDYTQYEDQADDLNQLTSRISHLTAQLKRRGIYDASIDELKRLARAGDNVFVPVPGDKYNLLAQRGGLPSAFQAEDLSASAKVLMELYKQRDQLIQSIYEITGISDIMRGATDANETATAQNIKAQFGSMRLKDRQREVQRWVRDGYRIKAELIVEHFEPQVIAQMTGMDINDQLFQQAVQLLKDEKARGYSIDIETDSTVFEDAEQEKNARVELLTAMGGFAQQWLPIIQAAPEMLGLVGEMMSFGVRGFKAGRQLEDKIDEVMQAIQQRMSQPQQPPPDPAVMKVEAEMKRDEQSHQMDMQTKQIEQQGKVMDLQFKQQGALIDVEKARAMADAKVAGIGADGRMLN